MKKIFAIFIAAAIMVLSVLCLSACSSKDDSAKETTQAKKETTTVAEDTSMHYSNAEFEQYANNEDVKNAEDMLENMGAYVNDVADVHDSDDFDKAIEMLDEGMTNAENAIDMFNSFDFIDADLKDINDQFIECATQYNKILLMVKQVYTLEASNEEGSKEEVEEIRGFFDAMYDDYYEKIDNLQKDLSAMAEKYSVE